MTLKLENGKVIYDLYFNKPNLPSNQYGYKLTSQYSNGVTLDVEAILVDTNSRYSHFTIEVPLDMPEKHLNGIYDYTLVDSGDVIIDKGLLKLIGGSGGTMNTEAYVSDNENNESTIYYRPNY